MLKTLSLGFLLILLSSTQAQTLPGVWIEMSTTPGPQMLWLPSGIDGVKFQGKVSVEGDWDVLPGGWKSLHRVTQGQGTQATELQSRLALETGGQVILTVMAPANLKKVSCLIGTARGVDRVRICLRAVPGGRGGVKF